MTKLNINLPRNRIEQMKKKTQKEWKEQNKQIFSQKNKLLSIILKSHLVVETTMESLLTNYNPDMKKYIIEKKFGEKIDILRFCRVIDVSIYEKLKTLNKIRNRFAHNVNYKLPNKDIEPLIKGLRIKHKTKLDKVMASIKHLMGYLTFLQNFTRHYPFIYTVIQKHDIFHKDKVYKKLRKDLKKVLQELSLEAWEMK